MALEECTFHLEENGEFLVTDAVKEKFNEYGFIYVKNLLSSAEVDKIKTAIEENDWMKSVYRSLNDSEGNIAKLTIWNTVGDDLIGVLTSCDKTAGTTEQLLGRGEVYHYHTKLSMKDARTGGSFEWHQDYGYWYNNGCLLPDMATIFIALDECKPENGCLKVIPRSHKCGRIDHGIKGKKVADPIRAPQVGADITRVEQILAHIGPAIDVILAPGDGLFFHSNVLHTSGRNTSPERRFAYLISYNTKENNPVIVSHHSQYIPLKRVANSAILECDTKIIVEDKQLMLPDQLDVSIDTVGKQDN